MNIMKVILLTVLTSNFAYAGQEFMKAGDSFILEINETKTFWIKPVKDINFDAIYQNSSSEKKTELFYNGLPCLKKNYDIRFTNYANGETRYWHTDPDATIELNYECGFGEFLANDKIFGKISVSTKFESYSAVLVTVKNINNASKNKDSETTSVTLELQQWVRRPFSFSKAKELKGIVVINADGSVDYSTKEISVLESGTYSND